MTNGLTRTQISALIALMTALLFFNYIDRGNLATVGPLLIDGLKLTNTQFGVLLGAFFWTYAPAQLLQGWLSQRVDLYKLLTLGVLLWSLVTATTVLAGGFATLLGLRLILGLGESVVFPVSSVLFAELVPEARRGAANGWMNTGLWIGPMVGTFAGAAIAARHGWQATFLIFGAVSLLWLWPWLRFARQAPHVAPAERGRPPPYRELLSHRAAWGTFLGHFSNNYSFYFLIGWLPTYLVKVRGLSLEAMGLVGGLVFYSICALACVAAGWYSDRRIAAGASVTFQRKLYVVGGQLGTGACMLAVAALPEFAVPVLLVSAAFFGMSSGGVFGIGQTLGGPRAAGQWIGVQNFIGNLAGVVALPLTGMLVDHFGSYGWAFGVAGGITFLGAASWGLMVGKIEPIAWRAAPSASR